MSLILKGIDLPKGDIVIHYANKYGEMETVYVDVSDIIQISKGHGRLIDADKLFYEEVGKIKPRNDEHYKAIGEFMNMITNAPTILDKERE